MQEKIGNLDVAPLLAAGRAPAMVTLTYGGGHLPWCLLADCAGCGWLLTAPDHAACRRHLDLLRKRFKRAWGEDLACIWKREFQRRGAPHWHLWMVPPAGEVKGLSFREWLAVTWNDIIFEGLPEADAPAWMRAAHLRVTRRHETVSYREGARSFDPRRLASYFAKHGLYSAKDYQNVAPVEWTGSVGRYWGVWGIADASVTVEIEPNDWLRVERMLRRLARARGSVVKRRVARGVDYETGEVARFRWVRRRARLMRGGGGFLLVNDGAALVSQIARALDRIHDPGPPVGRYLP